MVGTRTKEPAFRFDVSLSRVWKNIKVDDALEEVRKAGENIHYIPLRDKNRVIDPTGMVADLGLRFSQTGFSRMCTSLDIPRRFINRMSTNNPTLAAEILNETILHHGKGLNMAVNEDVIEGVVTNQYSRLENLRVLETVAEVQKRDKFTALRLEGLRMRVSDVPDSSYLDLSERSPNMKVGDIVGGGLDVFNGEDGGKAFAVSSFLLRLVCSNGMVSRKGNDSGSDFRIVHRGGGLRDRAAVYIQRCVDSFNEMRDLLPRASDQFVDKYSQKIIVEDIAKKFTVGFANDVSAKAWVEAEDEGHKDEVTLYNFFNAITFQAHSASNITRARDIEAFGTSFLENQLKEAA